MDLIEYKKMILDELLINAEYENTSYELQFLKYSFQMLSDAEEANDLEECYFELIGKNRKKIQIDGYGYDNADKSFIIVISEFSNKEDMSTITKTQAMTLYGKMCAFIEDSYNEFIQKNADITSIGYGVARELKRKIEFNFINKFRLYIVTNHILSEKVKTIKTEKILDIPIELNIWDIERCYNVDSKGREKEPISIDIKQKYNSGLPCIKANISNSNDYIAYLAVIPGELLASIYDEYGSRLLEGNVRSFLSSSGKVNQGIKKTILSEPNNFFTYNNGIATTATYVETELTESGLIITRIDDFQIINGGQTTASLAYTSIKENADLSNIFIAMKLTVVKKELAEDMIPFISRYANSQNKVSEADFFSNSPFHIRMEQLSRSVLAPAVNGNQYQTVWYYERARGQYKQQQMKLTQSERAKFLIKYPKNQVITKTDLAKFLNSYNCKPHMVSKGAQNNMRDFALDIEKEWSKSNTVFNEYFFKKSVALAIIFKEAERIVQSQDWYEQGYRANIVTYSISKLFDSLKKNFGSKTVNFKVIWQKQTIYDSLKFEIIKLSKLALDHIANSNRPIQNVTEWCKKLECWELFQKIEYSFSDKFIKDLIDKEEEIDEVKDAKKEQKLTNDIEIETEVVKLGAVYWKKLKEQGITKKLLNPIEESFLDVVINMEKTGRTPTSKQAKRIMDIREKLINEGISVS